MKTVEDIMAFVDEVMPNTFAIQQKLDWYNTCESVVRQKAVKRYGYLETETTGEVFLPEGVFAEDITNVFLDGCEVPARDYRSGAFMRENIHKKVGIVYLVRHTPIMIKSYNGYAAMEENRCELRSMAFSAGESVDIDIGNCKGRVVILGTSGNVIYVSDPGSAWFLPPIEKVEDEQGSVTLALDMQVAAMPPYDSLYTDYLCAQICYYQKDFEAYNHAADRYNMTLDNLSRFCMQNASTKSQSCVKNLWQA